MERSNEDRERCAECGGGCCKRSPGLTVPSDFGGTRRDVIASVRERVVSGRWTLVSFIGRFVVRPSIAGHEGKLIGPCRGSCTFLSETGCDLSFANRPIQCRRLVPQLGEACTFRRYGDGECAKTWRAFNDDLREMTKRGRKCAG